MLYYDIDHKVGAVGALCPQAGIRRFSSWLFEAHFRSDKTNVRLRKNLSVFFTASGEKNNMVFRVFVLSDRNGQNLSCLMKCVGAKCTKRCCRVQQRSAQRCGFVFEVLVRGSLLTPHSSLLTCSCSRYAL